MIKLALLIHKENIDRNSFKKIIYSNNIFLWLQRSTFIHLVKDASYEKYFDKIFYGPNVTPLRWFSSLNNSYEQYWCRIMKSIHGYILHSERVKKQVMKNTNCNLFDYKYYYLKPCIQINLNISNIKDYNEREIDFLVYVKYADLNKKDDETILIQYLKKNYKIEIIEYGKHSKDSLLSVANNSKYLIYFSFYDTGALALLEMKLMGVWPISHQSEFIEKGYGSFIKELDYNINSSLSKLDSIYKVYYSPKDLSKNVYNNFNCIKSLYQLVKSIKKSLSNYKFI